MRESVPNPLSGVDSALLGEFKSKIESRIPRLGADGSLSDPTPLIDITDALLDSAKEEYGLDLGARKVKVYGKFEGQLLGGSVKTRPAIKIIGDAISSGRLTRDKVVFEATSGNFGISLGLLNQLGLKVIALVSRRLQDGVLKGLDASDVKTIDLDVEICPAPGLTIDADVAAAKAIAMKVRGKLAEHGLDVAPFDKARNETERLLARQDVIGLAKLLARAYDGFCPEQYDNELNPASHQTVTGPEIDGQLKALGESLADFDVVCTFGTGGTSTGISRYVSESYRRRAVRVVFPLVGQDVAGIRTKAIATGLKFYQPGLYLGEHEVDFEPASRLLGNFVRRGFDIGESSALALFATLQMINYGAGDRFVVVLADGAQKYLDRIGKGAPKKAEVSLEEARADPQAYDAVIWTHAMITPKDEGIDLLASALGCDPAKVKVARTGDVKSLIGGQETPAGIQRLIPAGSPRLLLVCMVGGTSLIAAKVLGAKGIEAQSLKGGIMAIATSAGKAPPLLLKQGD
ncbi:MAG: pyridoxal-phosphate dependent enzyme [Nitrososphaerales archaeon]|nr:pyridoxal-phosphate dependent enzyme [Nitrososphaerales archaeon]